MPKTATDQDLARLESQIAALRDDIAQIVSTLGDLGQTGAETLRTTLAAKLGGKLADATGLTDLGESAEAKLSALRDHTSCNPLQTLALAAGAGLLLGLIWGRR